MNKCRCQSEFRVVLARDYKQFKRVFDIGKHPAFIGRNCFLVNGSNGGALIYFYGEEAAAASLMNPHIGVLLALNVIPGHRGHGLGQAVMKFLMPNFARVVESKIEWFEGLGYVRVGGLKMGHSLNTQVMARKALFSLAGRLRALLNKRPEKSRRRERGEQ